MYTIDDFIENSRCITRYNYLLVNDGKQYLSLLNKFDRVYVTDEFIFSGVDAIQREELFFLKEKTYHRNETWWKDSSCYIFNLIIGERKDKLEIIDLYVKMNDKETPRIIRFDLLKVKKELSKNQKLSNEEIMNLYLNNFYVGNDKQMFKFEQTDMNKLVNRGITAVTNFTSFVVAASLAIILVVSYLDEDITNSFRTFIGEFLNVFMDSPFKN